MAHDARILGITGAPCTGKTKLAGWLYDELRHRGVDVELLPETARVLASRGIMIDKEMCMVDYEAFLEAYEERDRGITKAIAIADRTPVDHCSYLEANRNVLADVLRRHHDSALAAMRRYRLVLYVPIELPMRDDRFRETSPAYQRELDTAIKNMLAECTMPIVTVSGEREERRRVALAAVWTAWPELMTGKD